MSASENVSTLLGDLGKVQQTYWNSWFDLVQSIAVVRGNQTAQLWQNGMNAWKKSIEAGLEMQQEVSKLWLEQASETNGLKQSAELARPAQVKLELGSSASLGKVITTEDIHDFARISGDLNPVHLDESYAVKTRFKGRIAHGMLSAGLISAVLGTKLPGPGAIYLSQNLRFRAPVVAGDEITATATVVAQKEGKPIYTLETICKNQRGEVVLEGEAVILYEPVTV